MKNAFIAILFILLWAPVFGQATPEILIHDFFQTYATDRAKAVVDLYSTSSWASRNEDGIANLINKVEKL